MTNPKSSALEAVRALRSSKGYAGLSSAERDSLERDFARIERALSRAPGYGAAATLDDPFAIPLETPADLQRASVGEPARKAESAPVAPAPEPPPRPAGTEVIGDRARRALEAVDFPTFVAGLIQGTFQAIVDATAQQVREYATLVASLSRSLEDFSRDNVSPNQVRDWLAQKHPRDLAVALPKAGERGSPRLVPRRKGEEAPAWLSEYGLAGREFDEELTEGPLLDAGRRSVAEERLQTLATMVLMGINRIVVDRGRIKARLQFHAAARETVKADVNTQGGSQQVGIAGRQVQQASVATMVSTLGVNAQADVAIKADLVGEVSIQFRTETFNLERFADSQAISLITRHSRQQEAPASKDGAKATQPPTGGEKP